MQLEQKNPFPLYMEENQYYDISKLYEYKARKNKRKKMNRFKKE
jgi:hypothetical protein